MENTSAPVSVPRRDVELTDSFWLSCEKRIREISIPYQWRALHDEEPTAEKSGAVRNFRIAAGLEQGEFYGFVFQDSDVYKWLEGVAYSLEQHPDPALEARADELIALIGKAQQPDGYLDTYFIVAEPDRRWTNLHDCHEMYCAGHLIEAAVAYHEATGKRALLDIACRFADHIAAVFGPGEGQKHGYPGHEELELALMRLYRETQEPRYRTLCRYFLEQRGAQPYYFDEEWEQRGRTGFWSNPGGAARPGTEKEYNQSHLPVREQRTAVGHAVRAVYLYTAMADYAACAGDEALLDTCRALWKDVTCRQMYITGGIGATHQSEAFTFDYDLPNETVYAETCASIGLVFFTQRLMQTQADSARADVIERILYNIIPAAMALDGRHFLYVNPLEVWPEASRRNPDRAHVKPVRQPWFGCACCPPNLVRLVESLRGYLYRTARDTLYVDQYIGSSVRFALGGAHGTLTQTSRYPWDGALSFSLRLDKAAAFTLALRLPGWCPGARLLLNGSPLDAAPGADGYFSLCRTWADGERVELQLVLEPCLMAAHPAVRADAGRAAVQCGPVVYCAEEADNGENLAALRLCRTGALRVREGAAPSGLPAVEVPGTRVSAAGWGDALYRPLTGAGVPVTVRTVPYMVWGNRGEGEMSVWLRTD